MYHRRDAGLTLVELLVAMTILAIAFTIALALYDGARRSFKVGENVSEQQQAVRIAFDLVSSEIRLAGYNTNPDGNEYRPDEQIEAALETAIVLRADFDGADPADAHDPEDTLGGVGSSFLTVSTGNDEIHGYVLVKPNGPNGDTLTFDADVGQTVRDGTVETVTIDHVDLAQNDPPYTLYRISLDSNGSAPDGSAQRTVLIENVRSMRFTYYDRAGNQILPAPGGDDDPSGLRGRAAIRRVGLEIEALTRDPDLQWSDVTDADPDTKAYRKFSLGGDVTPRNLGLSGIKDYQADTSPPSVPAVPQLYPGHCGGLYVTWPPSPAQDETAYYRIRYGTDPGDLDGQRAVDGTEYYVGDLIDSQRYYVAVQAVDGSGNLSILGPTADTLTENTNTPESPLNLSVSDGEDERIELAWDAVTQNTASTLGDPESPLIRELEGYRVYRSSSSGFSPSSSNRIADQDDLPAVPTPLFTDTTGVNCRQYYYRVSAVDRCGREGDRSAEGQGKTFSDDLPAAPENLEAFLYLPGKRRIRWDGVRRDVDGDRIYIEDYYLYRSDPISVFDLPPMLGEYHLIAEVKGATEYIDSPPEEPDKTVWYRVRAKDDCPNVSAYSKPAKPVCWFSGHAEIDTPADGDTVTGSTPIEISVHDGSASYIELRLTIRKKVGGEGADLTFGPPVPGPGWSLTWDATLPDFPPGDYLIYAEVDQDNSGDVCTDATSIGVTVGP